MKFCILDENGLLLDAHVLLEPSAIIMLSRGGTAGTTNSQNQAYPIALRLILARLRRYGRAITGAWVDSGPARALPLAARQIYFPEDADADAGTLFSAFGRRMERVAKSPNSIPNKGNRNKRLRIEIATRSIGELARVIGAKANDQVPRSVLHLPSHDLKKVTEVEIWSAINSPRLHIVDDEAYEPHDYELLTDDGRSLSPSAVFALAASEALNFPVKAENFKDGVGSQCFESLEAAGWSIVRKGSSADFAEASKISDDEWAEGDMRRLYHLRRERHPGVARAKKAQMRRLHGKLYCEECGLDPVALFGEDGEACMEVHHRAIEVADMAPGHMTKLSDVECLCANCHRIRHKRIKSGFLEGR